MTDEIERKFLVRRMPDLGVIEPVSCERFYIFRSKNVEMRVQKKGNRYEIERKEIIDKLKAIKTKLEISKQEFGVLKQLASEIILRDGYQISENPDISIKVYHGRLEGLSRVEVEFKSEEEAKSFQVPDWFGEEITDSVVSRDAKLIDLSDEEFKNFFKGRRNGR